jgi:hypothetical protein
LQLTIGTFVVAKLSDVRTESSASTVLYE